MLFEQRVGFRSWMSFWVAVASLLLCVGSASAQGDGWDAFVAEAGERFGPEGERAAKFLAEHRPARDADLPAEMLLENLDYALRARREFPWARAVPEAMFLNDVLPYASLDETRESWRPAMYERARAIVAGAGTAEEAAQALNRELFNQINVHYNTGRKKPNQSISESIAQGRATCTGLSVILVNACRSVGIPARVAGVANWHDQRGNHTWVEVWDGQRWRFTGADEYNAAGLDRGWFTGDAARAVPGDPVFGVWASSWAPADGRFTMVWASEDRSVHAVDVTERYTPRKAEAKNADRAVRLVRVVDGGGARLECELSLVDEDGEVVAEGTTKAGRADLNDMPALAFEPGRWFVLWVERGGGTRLTGVRADEAGRAVMELAWDELGLSKDGAEAAVGSIAAAMADEIVAERAGEIESKAFAIGDMSLRYKERVFGEPGERGHALWISMHGGGGAPAEVNDRQWENQIRLYEPAEGVYVAPRAPTDTWNLWHQGHIDGLFDRLIGTMVASGRVDPDRVYLMGYSAGGDGVYQLAPRMADRFAAAAMMAGHPNESRPEGLRNLPFAVFMGADDAAYNRNEVARQWGDLLGELQKADPDGYEHFVRLYEGLGHWMERRDAEALPWMARHTRDPWPDTVVWRQDDVTHTRFYWLAVDPEDAKKDAVIRASVQGQRIELETADVPAVTLRLRDELIDLDRPIRVYANGELAFEGVVKRTEDAVRRSLGERFDPRSAAVGEVRVEIQRDAESERSEGSD
jgi:transglutaminase-like putative cysteine protease